MNDTFDPFSIFDPSNAGDANTYTNWTGVDAITSGSSVDTAMASSPSSMPSAAGLLDTIGKTIGTVADYGFRVQQSVASAQSRAQDTQFQSLMKSLGLKTATIQAETAATVAGYQAQGEIARARAQASGGGQSQGLSLPMLALIGFGLYMVSKK